MCEDRHGVVALPNIRGRNPRTVLAAAAQQALEQLGENEQLIAESVRIDGGGAMRPGDETVMDWGYTYVVMVPGCTGWATPAT